MKPIVSTRRQFLKRATGLAALTAVLPSIVRGTAPDKAGEFRPNSPLAAPTSVWMMQIALRHPNLVPPAVQFAIMDQDPVPGFTARIKRVRHLWKTQLRQTKDEHKMMAAWDSGFRQVTGDRLYLLTSGVLSSPCGVCSNGADGKKWLVTKVVSVDGEPVCWSIPVAVRPGGTTEVTLTDQNTFDLVGAYETAMS
jgi:hypothetical protein